MSENINIQKIEENEIPILSSLATEIVREHFDPIIGRAQNDYMLEKFQSISAIKEQFHKGYLYYWVKYDNKNAGVLGFYPIENKLYLSKFYLSREYRGKKISRKMHEFIVNYAKSKGLISIYLNVNRNNDLAIKVYEHLGFVIIREEKNDIGNGYYMDDFVFEYKI